MSSRTATAKAPTITADPVTDGFTFLRSNGFGEIHHAELQPGDMRVKTNNGLSKWIFGDPGARENGDMSAATVPTMTTHLSIGDDVAFLTMEREGKPGSWHLSLPDAIVGQQWPPAPRRGPVRGLPGTAPPFLPCLTV